MIDLVGPVVGVDPSSSVTGCGVLSATGELVDAWKLTPKTRKYDQTAIQRIDTMCAELWDVLELAQPQVVVVEITSGKVGQRHKGDGAGLAVYGMAVGAMWRVVWTWIARRNHNATSEWECVPVPENVWTAGVAKRKRMANIERIYSGYDPADDRGGDVADAIGLAAWWLTDHRRRLMIAGHLQKQKG